MKIGVESLIVRLMSSTVAKVVGGLMLMSATFLFGVIAAWIFFAVYPTKVTLCQLAQYPETYRNRLITIEADAVSTFGININDVTCSASINIWPDLDRELSPDVKDFDNDSKDVIRTARILVTGYFDPNATMGCFTAREAIQAKHIELKSVVRTLPYSRENLERIYDGYYSSSE